jgi:hypothetical protein
MCCHITLPPFLYFLVLRFGPLVWRSSKERKKAKKAARNAKCNSGDSGIQIEVNFIFVTTVSFSLCRTN